MSLYDLKVWRYQLRPQQLARQPLCERCLAAGNIVEATVVHHKEPHRGDMKLFKDPDNLESICKTHHDAEAQREEKSGVQTKAVGRDGWPV